MPPGARLSRRSWKYSRVKSIPCPSCQGLDGSEMMTSYRSPESRRWLRPSPAMRWKRGSWRSRKLTGSKNFEASMTAGDSSRQSKRLTGFRSTLPAVTPLASPTSMTFFGWGWRSRGRWAMRIWVIMSRPEDESVLPLIFISSLPARFFWTVTVASASSRKKSSWVWRWSFSRS